MTLPGVLITVCLVTAMGGPDLALARDETQPKLAVQLLEAMQMKKSIEDQYAIMRHMQIGMMGKFAEEMGVSSEVAKSMEPMQEEMIDLLEHELSWEATKAEYAEIYASTFTAEEIAGLITFYQSPLGRALLLKTPDLTVKTMEITQRRMANVLPKIRELVRKHTQDTKQTPRPR
jgi:uncharacterized protein